MTRWRCWTCAALEVVTESTPPPDAEDPDWRAALVGRYQAVAPVLKVLPGVITFGASAEDAPCWPRCKRCPACWPTAAAARLALAPPARSSTRAW